MRKASLNILHSDLQKIIKSLGLSKSDSDMIFNRIINDSSKYPLRRSVIFTKASNRSKLSKIANQVELFNRILNSERSRLHHKAIRQILKTDKSYSVLCKISNDAEEFCRLFELTYHEGFQHYCKIGLNKIGRNYRLNKFITHKDYIFDTYERNTVVENNEHVDLTSQVCLHYIDKCKILDEDQMVNIWSQYGHDFVYCTEQILQHNANHETWINSQFLGLEYLDVIPEPYQLHGEEALKRYLKHGKVSQSNWRDEARKRRKKND
jgi:hypothetical protein